MSAIPVLTDFDDAASYSEVLTDELMFGDALDPYPRLREIAQRGAVQEGEFRALLGLTPDMTLGNQRVFIAFGPDEIREVLTNVEVYSNDHYKGGLGLTFGNSLSAMNPPEHPRYRRIFQKAFLPHVVASWSDEFVDPVINQLIDRFIDRGHADLMSEFAFPYPFEIIYRQLRLPPGEEKLFHKIAIAQTQYMVDLPHARAAGIKLGAYFQTMLEQRRRAPGTDLVSVLATVEDQGERLPDDVVISFLRQLINAAGDTTYRSTGNMLVALLLERPDQFEMVKRDRSLIPRAIEETLRWEGPVNLNFRTVLRDVVLGGVHIPAGSVVQTVTGVANRDPTQFPDPDRFDLTRDNSRRHMAFATGPHICLGQHLARLEMTRAMNYLLDRLPKLRLDPERPRPQIRGCSMRVPKHIYVRFD
jgi:cytochrome P450